MAVKNQSAIAALGAFFFALAILPAVFPDWMVSPGRLKDSHAFLATNCLACHSLFQGVSSAKCQSCHSFEKDGAAATTGAPRAKAFAVFHRQLTEKNCVACHSDHEGTRIYRAEASFSHDLIAPQTRERCEACHEKPGDELHQKQSPRRLR